MPQEQNTQVTPADLANVIAQLISAEPKIVAVISELAPISAGLPAPWNLLSSPLVTEAVSLFPTLLPLLGNLESALQQISSKTPSGA